MCLQLDDDIKVLYSRTQEVLTNMDPEDWYNEIIRAFQLLEDLGARLFSVCQTPRADIRQYNKPFTFFGTAGAVMGFYKPNLKAVFDEKIGGQEQDADFVLQELLLNRIVLIVQYWAVDHDTDTNKGGQQVGKNSEKLYRNVEYIKAKWGRGRYTISILTRTLRK